MKYSRIAVSLWLLVSSLCLNAQTVPIGYLVNSLCAGWNQPVGATFNKSGTQLFVWEKAGLVWVCNWDATTHQYIKQSTPVIDINEEVGNWNDHGMLGFALDPHFDINGQIYLFYVVDRYYLLNYGTSAYQWWTNDYFSATIGRITRYKTNTVSGIVSADLTSRKILLGESKTTGIPINYDSHGVGSLAFAADGTLLASEGEGSSFLRVDNGSVSETYYIQALADGIIRPEENVGAFRAQMINSYSGKILRIDPTTGDGIPSNPFYSAAEPRAAKSRVWALGFRNPFRFSIKPNTGSTDPSAGDVGELYVGDVGFNTYEELDIVKKGGANFGWPIFEGYTPTAGYATTITYNKDEPNPLYGVNGCTQQYLSFQNLIKQATADNDPTVYNPFDPTQAITGSVSNRYFHNVPAIDWKHGKDSARVGIFSGNTLTVAQLGSLQSGANGNPFRGNCSVGGCWYTGNNFPSTFKNTYFQADYGGKWLQDFHIQNGVVTEVDSFAKGFAAIVCVVQNPLDGNLLFVDVGTNKVSEITSALTISLPVTLISFNVTATNDGNMAEWVTASEENVDSFELERSTNGFDFASIDNQPALNKEGQNRYSFNDGNFPHGDIYYRLRMVDIDKHYKYSNVVKLSSNAANNEKVLLVTPDPVVSNFTLSGNFSEDGTVQVVIRDIAGKKIKVFNKTVTVGFNSLFIGDLNKLQSGVYFVEVHGKDTVQKAKFVKAQ
ncbi:MAG TPA: PQQ-dependent sugar dehydrogenase [Chitinophagaceae bacterium]